MSGGHPLTAAHPTRRMATPQPGAAVPAAPCARALDRLLSCPMAGARAGAPPRAGVRRARRRGAPRARLSGCHAPAPRQARGWPRGQRGRKPACAALPSPVGARQRWCGGPGAGRATCARAWAEPGGVRASRSRLAPHALFWQVGKPPEPRVPHGRRCATPRPAPGCGVVQGHPGPALASAWRAGGLAAPQRVRDAATRSGGFFNRAGCAPVRGVDDRVPTAAHLVEAGF